MPPSKGYTVCKLRQVEASDPEFLYAVSHYAKAIIDISLQTNGNVMLTSRIHPDDKNFYTLRAEFAGQFAGINSYVEESIYIKVNAPHKINPVKGIGK